MLCIDLRSNKEGLAMIEMVCKNLESYAKNKKAKLSHTVQSMIRHSLNKHYRQIVSLKDLKMILIDIGEVKNAKVICGPHRSGLKG